MLPDDIVEFLHGPQILCVGTRSDRLRPAVGRPMGVIADAPRDLISFILPQVQCEPHLTNIADNGMIAFTAGHATSHQNYQFKGRAISVRPSTPADTAVRDVYRDKMIVFFRQWLMPLPDHFFGDFIVDPSTTITFRVAKIFNQMPGPKAGQALDFVPAQD
jgi:hypothetical protein